MGFVTLRNVQKIVVTGEYIVVVGSGIGSITCVGGRRCPGSVAGGVGGCVSVVISGISDGVITGIKTVLMDILTGGSGGAGEEKEGEEVGGRGGAAENETGEDAGGLSSVVDFISVDPVGEFCAVLMPFV